MTALASAPNGSPVRAFFSPGAAARGGLGVRSAERAIITEQFSEGMKSCGVCVWGGVDGVPRRIDGRTTHTSAVHHTNPQPPPTPNHTRHTSHYERTLKREPEKTYSTTARTSASRCRWGR